MYVMLGDHALHFARRRPPLRTPATRWQTIAECADQHEDEIDRAQGSGGLPDADRNRGLVVVDQKIREGSADHGAAAKPSNGESRGHPPVVRKPLDQRRNWRNVAEAETNAAKDTGAEPHEPELMKVNAEGADKETAAPAQRGDDAGFARSGTLQPT